MKLASSPSLLMLALIGCAPPSSPERVVEPRTSAAPAARGEGLLRSAMLKGHNAARAEVGAMPLTWNPALADDAARYGAVLARTRVFQHSPQPRGAVPEGENLFTGTRGAYGYDEMVALWAAERRYYRPAPTPDFSSTGKWQDVAHYTQMVWRGTTEIGCALASNATDDYLVCRYAPPGNVVGRRVSD